MKHLSLVINHCRFAKWTNVKLVLRHLLVKNSIFKKMFPLENIRDLLTFKNKTTFKIPFSNTIIKFTSNLFFH